MQRKDGFTLIELMVGLAIIGILFASAIPLYQTWQQRAYGSEAAIMVKQILDAEIIYYLENDVFYPYHDRRVQNQIHSHSSQYYHHTPSRV